MRFLFFSIMFCIIISIIFFAYDRIRKNHIARAKLLREYEEEQKKKEEERIKKEKEIEIDREITFYKKQYVDVPNLNQMLDVISEKWARSVRKTQEDLKREKKYSITTTIEISLFYEYIKSYSDKTVYIGVDDYSNFITYFRDYDIIPFDKIEQRKEQAIEEMAAEKIYNRLNCPDIPDVYCTFDKLKCRNTKHYEVKVTIKNTPQGVKL